MMVPQKIKIELSYGPSNSTYGYLSEGEKKKKTTTNPKTYIHPHVHRSIIYNSQDVETT